MKFKRPTEYESEGTKAPVSCRITREAKKAIKDAAKEAKMTPSELMGKVLEDYAKFLKGN